MEGHSYWEKDALLQQYDLIVIGAGIVGLSSSLFFKRSYPDRSILVIERGQLPSGASTRNAGFACIGSISEHQADLEHAGEEQIKKRIKKRFEGLQLLKKTLGEDNIGYIACGGYELFTTREAFSAARKHIKKFNRWLVEMMDEQEVYSEGSLNGYPVIENRLEGALHPGKMISTLIKGVQQAGVDIRWGTPVHGVNQDGTVTLADRSSFQGEQLLVATNGFARNLLPEVDVQPARGYVFVTNPIKNLPWRGTFHHDRGYIYFRNIGDRLLLGGARNIVEEDEQTEMFGINSTIKDHLLRFADEVLKLPGDWKIEHEWSGIMGFTDTKTPLVKRLGEHLSVAVGLSGMGVAIGMEVGREAANLANSKSE